MKIVSRILLSPENESPKTDNRFDRALLPLLLIFVFAFSFIWFSKIHPLLVYDADDWYYISYFRHAFPDTSMWNPARIFPETFMAIPSTLAVHTIYPFTHDYIGSITIGYAAAAAGFLTIYLYFFTRLAKCLFARSNAAAVLCALLFLLMHFSIFKDSDKNNFYMFHAPDITCFFFYTMGSLLNGSLLFYFARHNINQQFKSKDYLKNGLLLVAVYLAIFSNMFPSIIFVVFIGVEMLLDGLSSLRKKEPLLQIIRNNIVSLAVVVTWLICLLFETQGGRAGSLGSSYPLSETISALASWRHSLNKPTFFVGIISVGLGLLICFIRKNKEDSDRQYLSLLLKLGISMVLAAVYLTLVATKTGSVYLKRAEAIYSVPFFAISMTALSAAYVLKNANKLAVLLPITLYILLFSTMPGVHVFREFNIFNEPPQRVEAISNYFLEQVLAAVDEGNDSFVLKVPVSSANKNWPHSTDRIGKNMSTTLLRHGLIDYSIEIEVEADEALNRQFHLDK